MSVVGPRLKRRLLEELVERNLDEMRPGPPRARRRRPRRALVTLRLAIAALLPLTLFAATRNGSHAGAPGESAAGGDATTAERPSMAATDDGPDRLSAEALAPVDAAVFPLAVRRIVLDPGHGGINGGTQTPSGLVEKDLTLDIARRLRDELADGGFEVRLTRDDDTDVSLEQRARIANRADADLFLSIHVNWIANRGVRGVETYYLGTTDDPFLNRLAAEENRGSGFAMADLRSLLDELYAGLRGASSERAAAALQRSLLRSLRTVNPAVEDRGVKTAPFIVLMKTDMPAVLAEVSCLSNAEEAELLAKPLYRQYIAEALASGVASYAAAPAGRPAGSEGKHS